MRPPTRHLTRLLAAVIACGVGPVPAQADLKIITTYEYNADGALTATTTTAGSAPPTTTYNTYDNFTPTIADPSTGAVSRGNGNLLAIGPAPGSAGDAQFAFDQRDRLIGCAVAGQPAVTYGYHANSLLESSTLAGGDTLQFYYGAAPTIANMRQSTAALSSSFLGPVRYLSDGTEQALLTPRKDVAGLYQPGDESLLGYRYDPYGAAGGQPWTPEAPASGGTTWDLSVNPFQYSGEYYDAVCDAYYLRARWYLPARQTFLSRDPVDRVHRYGYTGGNPIGRIDPSGMSYTTYQAGVGRFVHSLGFGATALSVLPWTGEAMFLLEATAAGKFWQHLRSGVSFGLGGLALGVSAMRELSGPVLNLDRLLGYRTAFGLRSASDVSIGLGQTAFGAFTGKHWRFAPHALGESIGTTLATVLVGRVGIGLGYRPFSLSHDDVIAMVEAHRALHGADGNLLVFRAQTKLEDMWPYWSSPLMERTHLGIYHEAAVAMGPDAAAGFAEMHMTQLEFFSMYDPGKEARVLVPTYADSYGPSDQAGGAGARFQFVGVQNRDVVTGAFRQNPLGFPTKSEQKSYFRNNGDFMPNGYGMFGRNCQRHVAGVLTAAGL